MHYNVQCGSVSFDIDAQGQCVYLPSFTNPSTCYGDIRIPGRDGSGVTRKIHLDDDEAILTLGRLPPPAHYYGYYSYISQSIDPTASSPTAVNILAPIGPAMNQRNADPGLHSQIGGSAYQLFGVATAIITTANKITRNDIVRVMSSVYGVSQARSRLNVEKLPVDLVALGSSGSADTLRMRFRLTPFVTDTGQFDSAAVQYMRAPPLHVFRISPRVPRIKVASVTYHLVDAPLPNTKIVPGQVWEQSLLDGIGVPDANQALNTIIDNVISDRAAKGRTLQKIVPAPSWAYRQGRSCIAAFRNGVALAEQSGTPLIVTDAMLCEEASPDAAYFGILSYSDTIPQSGSTGPISRPISFPSGGEIVWVGVNHGTLGSVTYSSVSLQQPDQYANALANVDLEGSATPFLGSVPAAAGSDFYVVSIKEACTQGSANCLYAPGDTELYLLERAYLSSPTATGPDYTDLVPSVWLVFNPP